MRVRVISAAVGIPLFLGLAFWGEIPFAAGVTVLSFTGLGELVRAYRAARISANLVIAATGILPSAFILYASIEIRGMDLMHASASDVFVSNLLAILLVVLSLAMLLEVIIAAISGEANVGTNMAFGLLCGAYVALFGGLPWLLWLGNSPQSISLAHPTFPLLLAVFCVWATDSFAFFVGRAVGKRKLAPKLSPNKTVEGALGGLTAGVLVGALFGWLFFRNVGIGLTIGAIAGVFGQVGDLFESALKREIGIKDFGGILPGHGGVLDRFDSLLFVAPLAAVVFHYWRF
jgi:phosphatidate cytidylyltransferase